MPTNPPHRPGHRCTNVVRCARCLWKIAWRSARRAEKGDRDTIRRWAIGHAAIRALRSRQRYTSPHGARLRWRTQAWTAIEWREWVRRGWMRNNGRIITALTEQRLRRQAVDPRAIPWRIPPACADCGGTWAQGYNVRRRAPDWAFACTDCRPFLPTPATRPTP